MNQTVAQPLSGLRVIDLTQIYQGPYAAFLLAMAGADVIKVEPVGGERLRGAGGAMTPLSFAMLNSNKRSVTLNLQDERGCDMLCQLVRDADILLENYAPGVMDRLGVGWDVLEKINPMLIYGSGTGYGLSGPNRDMLAMDHTIQAASGIMSVTGDADQPPSRAGGAPCDIMGGIHLYAGVLTALHGRTISGRGTRVEVSMIEAMYFTLCSELASYHASGKIPPRNSARSPARACPYGRYRCRDGWIAIISVSENHWRNILDAIGRPELKDDENFADAGLRKRRESEVNAIIEDWSAQRTRNEAYGQLREARVPVAPVRTIDEVTHDPHMHERGMLYDMVHELMGEIVLPGSPIRYSHYDRSEPDFFPEPGQHNQDIYGETLGLSADQLAVLQRDGVI